MLRLGSCFLKRLWQIIIFRILSWFEGKQPEINQEDKPILDMDIKEKIKNSCAYQQPLEQKKTCFKSGNIEAPLYWISMSIPVDCEYARKRDTSPPRQRWKPCG